MISTTTKTKHLSAGEVIDSLGLHDGYRQEVRNDAFVSWDMIAEDMRLTIYTQRGDVIRVPLDAYLGVDGDTLIIERDDSGIIFRIDPESVVVAYSCWECSVVDADDVAEFPRLVAA